MYIYAKQCEIIQYICIYIYAIYMHVAMQQSISVAMCIVTDYFLFCVCLYVGCDGGGGGGNAEQDGLLCGQHSLQTKHDISAIQGRQHRPDEGNSYAAPTGM